MPVYLPGPCIKRVQGIVFRCHNHLSTHHEWLSIHCSVEWLFPEIGEAGRIRFTCDKPATSIVIVVHGPIGAGHLNWRCCTRREREWRNLHSVRWWDTQGLQEQMNRVPLGVEETSEQDNDDEYNRQTNSPAFCKAARVFMSVLHVVRFSHKSGITSVFLSSHYY